MEVHEFEMALTRADFLRLLPVAAQGPFKLDGDEISGNSDDIDWKIVLHELEPRQIALLSLPRLNVSMRLDARSADVSNAWLRRFLLGFQRAGG